MNGYEGNDDNLVIEAEVDGKCVKVKIVVDNKDQELANMGKFCDI